MPSHTEDPYTAAIRKQFCLALKAERERKGITLSAIAASTKIPASIFAGLERSDLRHWPKGLFRRSFFRDYVRAIGLPPEEMCEEFVRLFPDGTGPVPAEPVDEAGPPRIAERIARVSHQAAETISRVLETPRLRVRIKLP